MAKGSYRLIGHDDPDISFFSSLLGKDELRHIFMNEDGTFSVTNQKDGSEDLFTEAELSNPELSIIGKAIQKGQFHSYYDFK